MKTSKLFILICNVVCGFIQLILAFIVEPFLILVFPLFAIAGIAVGYKTTYFSDFLYQTISLVVMLVTNLIFFILVAIIHLYNPADVYSIQLMLMSMLLFFFWNFVGAGGLLSMWREKMK